MCREDIERPEWLLFCSSDILHKALAKYYRSNARGWDDDKVDLCDELEYGLYRRKKKRSDAAE